MYDAWYLWRNGMHDEKHVFVATTVKKKRKNISKIIFSTINDLYLCKHAKKIVLLSSTRMFIVDSCVICCHLLQSIHHRLIVEYYMLFPKWFKILFQTLTQARSRIVLMQIHDVLLLHHGKLSISHTTINP